MNGFRNTLSICCALFGVAACGTEDAREEPAPGGGATASIDGGVATQPADGGAAAPGRADGGSGSDAAEGVQPATDDCAHSESYCFEAHGTYQGEPFTCSASFPDGRVVVKAMEEGAVGVANFGCAAWAWMYGAVIPVASNGTFDVETGAPDAAGLRIGIDRIEEGRGFERIAETSGNFAGARAVGVVGANGAVRGTVNARWDAPAPGCVANTADGSCREASMTMAFHWPLE